MRMRLFMIAASISLLSTPASAGTSIVAKAQGSTGWSQDLGQDSSTLNLRPVVYLLDATTGNPITVTPGNEIAPNNTTGINLKASAGTVYGIQLGSISANPAYLKLYNKATAPTCGTDTPVKRLIIPANSTPGAGSNISFSGGVSFTNGIGYCVTTGITDADTTAPAANTFLINIDWN
jgi:hypothetical protein